MTEFVEEEEGLSQNSEMNVTQILPNPSRLGQGLQTLAYFFQTLAGFVKKLLQRQFLQK